MKKIVVFAGNGCRREKEAYYFSLAYKTGKLLAKNGFITVTGGGPGLMNEVSRGAFEAGGETIGICLDVFGREQSKYLSKKIMYKNLEERKNRLLSEGDGFLVLPGGIGTFHEIFSVLALKRKNEISEEKPLIFIDRYYHEFTNLIKKMIAEGFVDDSIYKLFSLAQTPKEAIERLKEMVR